MDDMKKEIEEYFKQFEEILEVVGPIGDIIIVALEKIKDTGVSSKIGKIIDLTLGELTTMFTPISDRWINHKDKWVKHQYGLVSGMTGNSIISDKAAIEILKLSRGETQSIARQLQSHIWEYKAKRLEHKLAAVDTAKGILERVSQMRKQ